MKGRPKKHIAEVGKRYGTRVVTKSLGKRGPHEHVELLCDCGFVSTSAVFQLVNEQRGCPRKCKVGMLPADREQLRLEKLAEAKAIAERFKVDAGFRRDLRREKARELYANGLKQHEVAHQLGLSRSMVCRIIKGER